MTKYVTVSEKDYNKAWRSDTKIQRQLNWIYSNIPKKHIGYIFEQQLAYANLVSKLTLKDKHGSHILDISIIPKLGKQCMNMKQEFLKVFNRDQQKDVRKRLIVIEDAMTDLLDIYQNFDMSIMD